MSTTATAVRADRPAIEAWLRKTQQQVELAFKGVTIQTGISHCLVAHVDYLDGAEHQLYPVFPSDKETAAMARARAAAALQPAVIRGLLTPGWTAYIRIEEV